MKESYADFSIIQRYLDLREKYDREINGLTSSRTEQQQAFEQKTAALEQEIRRRNEHIKAQDQKLQQLAQQVAEKDEQLKTLGLQLHRLKMQQPGADSGTPDGKKKKLFT